jgi:guanylate kinase
MTRIGTHNDFGHCFYFIGLCATFVASFSRPPTMSEGKIIFFTAPSGSGKTTIVKHLLAKYHHLAFSVSATTRALRGSEVNGKDYHFLSLQTFKQKIAQGDFVEYEEVYEGVFYGTLHSEIARIWAEGKHVLLDIDVKGAISIKRSYPHNSLGIFVRLRDLATLEQRLRTRGTESEAQIQKRLARASYEVTFADRFDQIIINDDLETTLAQAEKMVNDFVA